MESETNKKRDKAATKQKLVEAAGRVILRDGFGGIGINSIAAEAGVDKVLIYRYFGGLDGLLKTYVAQKDYYSSINEEPVNGIEGALKYAEDIFTGQLKSILADKELQEILLWELSGKNNIATDLASKREAAGIHILKKIKKILPPHNNIDISAYSALIIGGIYYLALRSRTADVFNGIDLTSNRGWHRIEKAITGMLTLIKNGKD